MTYYKNLLFIVYIDHAFKAILVEGVWRTLIYPLYQNWDIFLSFFI